MKHKILFFILILAFINSFSQPHKFFFDMERQALVIPENTRMQNVNFYSSNRIIYQYGLSYERIIKNRVKVKTGFSYRNFYNSFIASDIEHGTLNNLIYHGGIRYKSRNFPLRFSIILQDNDKYQLSLFGGVTYRRYRSYNAENENTPFLGSIRVIEDIELSKNPYQIDLEYGVNFDFFIDSKKKHILILGIAFSKQYYSKFRYKFKVFETNFDGSKSDNLITESTYPISNTPYRHSAFQISYAYAFGK
jgi:hypothetical protein